MALSIAQTSSAVSAFAGQAQGEASQKNQTPLSGLQRRLESANTQLSAFGKVKLSLDDLQARAEVASNLATPPTLTDFKVAVQGVVQSVNSLSRTVAAAAASREANRAAEALDQRPAQALSEVRRAVAGPNESSLAALREIGITRQKDGTFEINEQRLEQAFRDERERTVATFQEVSSRVGEVAERQLSSNGIIGQRFNNLSERASELRATRDNAQARLDSQRSFQQLLASQLASAGSFVARNAVASYLTVSVL